MQVKLINIKNVTDKNMLENIFNGKLGFDVVFSEELKRIESFCY